MVFLVSTLVHILSRKTELKMMGESEIITPHMKHYLACMAPEIYRYRTWKPLFNISHDGVSYSTMFCKTKNLYPSYILIEDIKGQVFGAFLSREIRESNRFYGTGESFVFTFKVICY